jgi:glycosyltransferase 2 family protein
MKFGWKSALGVILTVVCLYFAFRNFKFAEAFEQAKHANYFLLVLSVVVATLMFPLRARRWRTILEPISPNLPFGPLWRAVAAGVMMTNVLPARAGELARPFMLSRERPDVPFSASLASVAVDRVFDAIVVVLLLALSVLEPHFPNTITLGDETMSVTALVRGFVILPAVLTVGLYALVFFPDRLIKLFELFARPVSRKLETMGSQMLRRFAEGLSVLRNPKHFFAVFAWTLAHWLVQPLAFWIGFRAFGIEVPLLATLFVQGVIVIVVALPSTPGFAGVYELGAVASLAAYGVDSTRALTWALVFHLASFIPITLVGAYYFARAGITMGDITRASKSSAPA